MTTRRLRSRGATVTVTAHGQILAVKGGVVNNWTNRFTQQMGAKTRKAAPRNRRIRWAHYGPPLKKTIMASKPQTRMTKGGFKIYGSAGSTAHYALFVDQGTNSFDAKILPPYYWGSPSLYEYSWEPLGRGSRLGTVHVRGQAAQEFFAKGLAAAFRHMKMRSYQIPADPTVGNVLKTVPRGLENFSGATPADAAFGAQLDEWRRWRNDVWNSGGRLGRFRGLADPEQSALREEAWQRSKAGRNQTDYETTGRAQQRRRRKQVRDLLNTEDRKAEGAITKAEQEAQIEKAWREGEAARAAQKKDRDYWKALAAQREAETKALAEKRKAAAQRASENRIEAMAFLQEMQDKWGDADYSTVKESDTTITYVVTWTGAGDKKRKRKFKH